MRKSAELSDPNSCLNKAKDDELLFVLLERDAAAADTVEFWCNRRIKLGKNTENDMQIKEARSWVLEVRTGCPF